MTSRAIKSGVGFVASTEFSVARPGSNPGAPPRRLPWPNLLTLFLIVPLVVNYFSPFADLDYTWQIRTGERIVQTGSLTPPESFSYTVNGQPVRQIEWLYDLTLYGVWSTSGYGGLKLLRLLLIAATLFLLARRLRREHVARHGVVLAVLLAMLTLAPFWNLRPLYCTTIGLLLVSGWLHDHCNGRRPLPWYLPIVLLLWGNLHPGVIVGQAVLLSAVLCEWLNRWLRFQRPLSRSGCVRLTLIGGLSLATSFIGPDPLERLLLPFRPEVLHPAQRIMEEMQPLYCFLLRPPYTAFLAYPLALVVGVTVLLRFRRYRLWELALLAGLAVLANAAVRSVQDWVLVMLALGAPHLAALLHRQGGMTTPLPMRLDAALQREMDSPLLRPQPRWLVAGLAVLAVASLIPPLGARMPRQDASTWPVAALDWIEAHQVSGRFFASPNHGSYIGWRLRDRGKVHVYTRSFCFPPELLEDAEYLPQLPPDWELRLERVLSHGPEFFLLETTGPRGQLWQAIQPHVGSPLYLDEQSVLLRADQVLQVRRRLIPRDERHANMP